MERSKLLALCGAGDDEWRDAVIGKFLELGLSDPPDARMLTGRSRHVVALIAGHEVAKQAQQIADLTDATALDQLPHRKAEWRGAIAANRHTAATTLERLAALATKKGDWQTALSVAKHRNVTEATQRSMLEPAQVARAAELSDADRSAVELLLALCVPDEDLVLFLQSLSKVRRSYLIRVLGRCRPAALEGHLGEIVDGTCPHLRTEPWRSTASDGRVFGAIALLPTATPAMVDQLGVAMFLACAAMRRKLGPRGLPQWEMTAELLSAIHGAAGGHWGQIVSDFKFTRELLLKACAGPARDVDRYHGAMEVWFRAMEEHRCFAEAITALALSGNLAGPMREHLDQVSETSVGDHPELVLRLLEIDTCRHGSVLGPFTTAETLTRVAAGLGAQSEIVELVVIMVRRRRIELNATLLDELGIADLAARTLLVSKLSRLSAEQAPLFYDVAGTLKSDHLIVPVLGDVLSCRLTPSQYPTALELIDGWEGSVDELIATVRNIHA